VLVVHRGMFDAPPFTDEGGVEVEYLRSAIFEKHSRSVAASYMDGYPALGHFVPMGLAAYEQAEAGEGYDLVELTDWPLYFLPWVGYGARVPFTISLHSSIGQMRDFEPMPGWEMETHFIRLLEAASFSAAPSVHTNSNLNARYWEGITNRKVDVLLPLLRQDRTTKGTNQHERGNADLTTEDTIERQGGREMEQPEVGPKGEGVGMTESKSAEGEAGQSLAVQAGASESDSLASKLADSPASELPNRSAVGPASAAFLDSRRSTLDSRPCVRGAVFARLQNLKGAELLCEALRLVPEVSVEWYGRTVTGTDGKRSYAEELEEKFPDIFGSQLLHIGEVSREEASRAMRSVDFVCVPSLWDVFNLTVVEAMQQGAVVICSRQAGAEMLVADGRNAFLFDPSSPENLVEVLRQVAGLSIERREEIGAAAKQTILENLDLASLTEARVSFYRSILDASPSHAASSFLKSLCNFPDSPIRKRRTIRSKVANILQRLPVFQARGGN
jgi:hypothetical protein